MRSFQPHSLLWLLVALLLVAKILFSLNIAWQIFNFAFQIDESEGMIVAETGLMDHGLNLYALPSPDRFVSAPYTPLYYLLNWPFIHLLGLSFKPGRLISFGATVSIAFLLYRMVRVYGLGRAGSVSRWPAIITALVWSSLGLVAFWGAAVKPDMTALLFDLAGLYLVFTSTDKNAGAMLASPGSTSTDKNVGAMLASPGSARPVGRGKHRPYRDGLYLAAGLFALAALTKQTAFAGVVVAGGWLMISGPLPLRPRLVRLVKFGLVYGGLAFGPMIIMNLLSSGGFWYHIVTVHELPWSGQNYAKFVGGFAQSYGLFGLLALVFVPLWLLDARGTGWRGSAKQSRHFHRLVFRSGLGRQPLDRHLWRQS